MTSPDTAAFDSAVGDAAAADAATGAAGGLVDHARALQSALTDLSTLTVSQLVALFRQYQNTPGFDHLLKAALPQIVMPHAQAAAQVTAQWYSEIDPSSSFVAKPTVNLPAEQLDKTIGWSLWAPTKTPPGERPTEQQMVPPEVTLSRLAGSTKRMVFDASRDTVAANAEQQGVRWARYASADACAFCRMMATKSSSKRLYRTEQSATRVVGRSVDLTIADRRMIAAGVATRDELLARRANYAAGDRQGRAGQPKIRVQRGTQELGEKYHDHCRCIAVPVPDGETYTPPDYTDQWSEDYKDAVKATKAAGKTKGEYGAIDFKAVLAHMRANTDAH